jgi:hypothetical protein
MRSSTCSPAPTRPEPRLAAVRCAGQPVAGGVLVLCEGFPDALTAAEAGIPALAVLGIGHAGRDNVRALADQITTASRQPAKGPERLVAVRPGRRHPRADRSSGAAATDDGAYPRTRIGAAKTMINIQPTPPDTCDAFGSTSGLPRMRSRGRHEPMPPVSGGTPGAVQHVAPTSQLTV